MALSHLVPKKVVRSDGVVTTVHVNPNKDATGSRHLRSVPLKLSTGSGSDYPEADELLGALRGGEPKFKPRNYQADATRSILDELSKKDRCSARAACGMGKTVIAQHTISEYLKKEGKETGVFVFLTPSIDLTDQSARAFDEEGILEGGHYQRIVHSKSESAKRNKSQEADIEELAEFLRADSDKPKVIFCTYQSYRKLQEAQASTGDRPEDQVQIDMAILDEAHFLGGEYKFKPGQKESDENLTESTSKGSIPRVFDNNIKNSLQVDKRVFLSATPDYEEEQFIAPQDQPRAKRHKSVTLAEAAKNEDSAKPKAKNVKVYFDSPEIFGRTVVNMGMPDAIREKALTPIEVFHSNLRTNAAASDLNIKDGSLDAPVGPDGNITKAKTRLTLNAWSTAAASLDSLANGNGHNALMFLPSIEESESAAESWPHIARAMADHDYSVAEARKIADDPSRTPAERRSARLILLAEYSETAAASSKSTEDERLRAFTFYDEKDKDGKEQRPCRCGKVGGGWCACARVVSNVDLFGQGIDIKSIDTVTIGDISKTSDTKFTQAIGRAMRLRDGKTKGFLVVPSLSNDKGQQIGSRLKTRTLNAVSRLMRDSLGATIKNEPMPEKSIVDFPVVFSEGEPNSTPDEVLQGSMMELKRAAVVDRAYGILWDRYNEIQKEGKGYLQAVNPRLSVEPDDDDSDPSDSQINSRPTISKIKEALMANGLGDKKDVKDAWEYVTKTDQVDDLDIENAMSRMKILEHKSRRFDTNTLDDEDVLVAKIAGHLQPGAERLPMWTHRKATAVRRTGTARQRSNWVRGRRRPFKDYVNMKENVDQAYETFHPTEFHQTAKIATQKATMDDLSTIVPDVALTWNGERVIVTSKTEDNKKVTVRKAGGSTHTLALNPKFLQVADA